MNMNTKRAIQINGVDIEWDTQRGRFSFFGKPSALFWINPSLLTMLKPLADEIGHSLYRLEVASSASLGTDEDYDAMVTVLGENFEEGFIKWGEAVSGAGWGIFEIMEFNLQDKRARVKVSNTWELLMQKGEENPWGCPFIQGKIIGIFSKALGVNCWADEGAISYDPEQSFVEFNIYESRKTITTEIERERHSRMQEKERYLTAEIARKTDELKIEKIRAESANIAKSKFLGAMSHELITPLNGILGLCELLQMDVTNESNESFLNGIMSSGKNMLTLVTQILSYSETTASSTSASIERVNPVTLIEQAIIENEVMAKQRKISVRSIYDEQVNINVVGDHKFIKEILLVFLANACLYIPEKGEVEIGLEVFDETVKIFVSDNGTGISEKNSRQVFNAFERLHNENSNISGAGVGLAVAKMLAEQIGGDVGYQTNESGGACFWLKLFIGS